jgi:hypothetical protein
MLFQDLGQKKEHILIFTAFFYLHLHLKSLSSKNFLLLNQIINFMASDIFFL